MAVRVAVIGATSWGTTLAVGLATKGVLTTLRARDEAEAALLNTTRENRRLLPGIPFPDALDVAPMAAEMASVDVCLVVVPSQRVRVNIRQIAAQIGPSTVIVSASKGLEEGRCLRMTEVLAEECPRSDVAALSGPNISREIAQGLPASTVVAARDSGVARAVRDIFMSRTFRAYAHTDVVGVELGGALKNVIALGAGILDGLKLGDNAKAALITRGLAEISRLGVMAGANPLTFSGLAGMGDLIVTCASPHSRNRHVGEELARGRTIDDIRASMTHVSEGVPTTAAAVVLARRYGVDMPIATQINRIVFEGVSARVAIEELMSRAATDESTRLDVGGYLPAP